MKGRLRFYNRDRGWGLIEPDGRGPDIFMPATKVVVGEPHKGARCVRRDGRGQGSNGCQRPAWRLGGGLAADVNC